MFLDGLVYTNVARNLSEGIGDFWHPLHQRFDGLFAEHPPLLMWLQSGFFRLFGDHLWTEDVYNLTVFGTTLLLIVLVWKHLVAPRHYPFVLLPLAFFLLNQEVQLRYPNTMLECGMTLIILLTVYAYLNLRDRGLPFSANVAVGVGVCLSFLAKGPAGLFPLSFPFLYELARYRVVSAGALLVPVSTTTLLLALLMVTVPEAANFLERYFDQQVLTAVSGARTENIADYRLQFLQHLLFANLPAVGIGLLLLFGRRKASIRTDRRMGYCLLSFGCLAIFPLVISPKQAAYYQLPAIPFLALGGGLLLLSGAEGAVRWLGGQRLVVIVLSVISSLAVLGSLVFAFSLYGTVDRRDRELLVDVRDIQRVLSSVDVDSQGYRLEINGNDWRREAERYRIKAYLLRYARFHSNRSNPNHLLTFKAKPDRLGGEGVLLETDRLRLSRVR